MLNRQILIGRVGQDPQVKMQGQDTGYARFSVATSEQWKDSATGERKESTTWHSCVAWGHLASIVDRYVRKGMLVYVEGPTLHRKFTQEDGTEKEIVEIRVTEMKMLSRNEEAAPSSAAHSDQGGSDGRAHAGQVSEKEAKLRKEAKEKFAEADIEDLPF